MSYFAAQEFMCRCGRHECEAPRDVSVDLLSRLDNLRYRLDRPVVITSGLRCAYWNARQSGTADSEHLTGEAADIACASGAERWAILAAIFSGTAPLFTRIGIGKTFVHLGASKTHPAHVTWTYYGAA